MMHTTAKRMMALCGMVVMLVLAASITAVPVSAAENGIYIATAIPSYRNPVTGVIEDSGGEDSDVLGQSMTESATYSSALVEVDQDGSTYVTIRLQMMDNIESVSFDVDDSYVSATIMQEDYGNNTADYRIPVNSEYSVIRCSMYVTAMGRDVVFFITLSGLQSGSEDFVTSIEVAPEEPEPETQAATEPETQPETEPVTEAAAEPETQPATEAKPAETKATEPKPTNASIATAPTAPKEDTKPTQAAGLQEFDASGNQVAQNEKTTEHQQGGMSTAAWVIIGIGAAGGVGFCVWYFGFFRKKK